MKIHFKIALLVIVLLTLDEVVGHRTAGFVDLCQGGIHVVHVGFDAVKAFAGAAAFLAVAAMQGLGDPAHGEDMLDVDLFAMAAGETLAAVECRAAPGIELAPEQWPNLTIC